MEHVLANLVNPALVQAEILAAVLAHPAVALDFLHVFNALCLFRNDIACNVLQWDEGGILQEVAGHFDGRLMVWDHLRNIVIGNAVVQFRFCHSTYYFVQNTVEGIQVIFCNIA